MIENVSSLRIDLAIISWFEFLCVKWGAYSVCIAEKEGTEKQNDLKFRVYSIPKIF